MLFRLLQIGPQIPLIAKATQMQIVKYPHKSMFLNTMFKAPKGRF